jgi:hypothetical protein
VGDEDEAALVGAQRVGERLNRGEVEVGRHLVKKTAGRGAGPISVGSEQSQVEGRTATAGDGRRPG